MSTKTRATIEDLYKVEGKAELVNGEIVEMPPAGDDPGQSKSQGCGEAPYPRRADWERSGLP